MVATAVEVAEAITAELDVFAPILQQLYLKNKYNREFNPLASIQLGAPIEFIVKGADLLYLDLHNTKLTVQVKITKANETNIEAAVTGPANLGLHLIFRKISIDLNGRSVSEPNQLYPYRAYIETILNYYQEVQNTRLLTEGWVIDNSIKMDITDVAGENECLKERTNLFDNSALVAFSSRPHLDMFQQCCVLLPGVDMHLKLVPSSNLVFINCAPPAGRTKPTRALQCCDREGSSHNFNDRTDRRRGPCAHSHFRTGEISYYSLPACAGEAPFYSLKVKRPSALVFNTDPKDKPGQL